MRLLRTDLAPWFCAFSILSTVLGILLKTRVPAFDLAIYSIFLGGSILSVLTIAVGVGCRLSIPSKAISASWILGAVAVCLLGRQWLFVYLRALMDADWLNLISRETAARAVLRERLFHNTGMLAVCGSLAIAGRWATRRRA